MFQVGNLVVHPMHGAGVIDDIVRERVAGEWKEYYVFKMPVGGLVLKIPVANAQMIGVRQIMTSADAEQLFCAIPALVIESNANWNKRYQENMLKMKSGDLYEVARVVKALMHRDRSRGLSTGERKMLHTAKQIMLSEMVLAMDCEYREAELRLDDAMMKLPAV